MAEYLLKQVLSILEPIGLVWFCLCVLAFSLWRRKQPFFAFAAAGLAIFMMIIGCTCVPDLLLDSLEKPYLAMRGADLPNADAIVILGGGAEPTPYELSKVHLSPAGDRIIFARALMKLGKAPVLILGGGGSNYEGRMHLESDHVRDLLASLDIPAASMISLGLNADTREEALHSRAAATAHGWNRILLVTSANHMRRASAVFRKVGFDVIPAPCNFFTRSGATPDSYGGIVPRYDGFMRTSTWLHEQAGWWIYRWRGWID